MYETYYCDILENINNKIFLKKLNTFIKNNPCCKNYPKCEHARIQSDGTLYKNFKELNKSIDITVFKYLGYRPNILHKKCWVFLNKAGEEIDSIRHNHADNCQNYNISAIAYLTKTNFGTEFFDSNKIRPEINCWNVFDSRLYHQAEKGIPKIDRYVLAFDVAIGD
jgi:hypothetical protein